MMNRKAHLRLICLLLTLTMVFSVAPPAYASPQTDKAAEAHVPEVQTDPEEHAPDELVRVTIELDRASTLDAGYSTDRVAENAEAVSYRRSLRSSQDALTARIEAATGAALDVKWNITLAMNAISANVRCGDIAKIKSIPGVKNVFPENRYDAPVPAEREDGDSPNTANTSEYMVGAQSAWAEGYTGAGSRIAIIDTGLDTTHRSMDADAFRYAIEQTGKSVSLFTAAELSAVKDQLNGSGATYLNEKIPFGYNYVDSNTKINHLSDTQGEHGSHVAGIAAANRFVKDGDAYADAAETVHAVGMAPDAQLFIMKVFGASGGAYDSDYMVAIEDAIVLGCDAVNLSLGSSIQGFTYSASYQATLNKLSDPVINPKTVVSISAGNAYDFAYMLTNDQQELYIEDVYMHTGGSPGTYVNSLCVASADNTGLTGTPMTFNGSQTVFYNETDSSGAKLTTIAGSYEYVYVDAPGSAEDYAAVDAAVGLAGKIVLCNRGDISFYEKGNNLISFNPKALIVANNTSGTVYMSLDAYNGTFPMVSITLDDANAIKAASAAHSAGSVPYYTGTVTVTAEMISALAADNPEMSDFSSWGVPGSLIMKPEITAPGGEIYSLNGTHLDTSYATVGGADQYEIMSGTSMAAPHVAGLTATLGQYLRENNVSLPGHTTRQIAQSLLMSTAVPMHIGSETGPYYPTIQAGAGLANVHRAIHASTVVFMGADATISGEDGKVKAELGDLPARSGGWTYSFELNNLANRAQTYALRTDLFTQARDESGEYPMMSRSTADLDWPVTYTVSGKNVTSVTVPAGSARTVQVTITVPEDMTEFDARYPAGAYLEGYTFVESSAVSSDGEKLDVEHSIPILGFYGSWTDPSMFDNTSYVDKNVYGSGKVPYSGETETNYVTYRRDGTTAYVTGNPYTTERPFPAEKLALRSTDTITQIKYNLIRSAGSTGYAVSTIDETGAVTGVRNASVSTTNTSGMYYSQSASAWQGTSPRSYSPGAQVSDYGAEGERIRVGYYAIPEYYAMKLNSDLTAPTAGTLTDASFRTLLMQNVLGRGAMIGYDFYIDNTAPVILTAVRKGSTVTVRAQDNCYLAWLAVTDATGKTVHLGTVPEQNAKNEVVDYTFELAGLGLDAASCRVLAGDYAANQAIVQPVELLYDITAESNNEAWGTVNLTGNVITATPAEGYYTAGYEVVSGSASLTQNGNFFTVQANSDCTVRILFAQKQPITVTFVASGAVIGTVSSQSAEALTLPTTATEFEGWSFEGWSEQTVAETDEAPTLFVPGATVNPVADTTYYAVYSRLDTGGAEPVFELVTEDPGDWTGRYAITYLKTRSLYAFTGVNTSTSAEIENKSNSTAFASTGMELNGTTLSKVKDNYIFEVAPQDGGYSIRSVSKDTFVGISGGSLCVFAYFYPSTCIWDLTSYPQTSGTIVHNANQSSQPYLNYTIYTNYFWANGVRNTSICLWKETVSGTTWYSTMPVEPPHEHALTRHAPVAPTCTGDGSIEYWVCSICGKLFSDAAAAHEITASETVIPALGHAWSEPVFTWSGYESAKATRTCERDASHTETKDAAVTKEVTQAPTPTTNGIRTYTASVVFDGVTYTDTKTETIPAIVYTWGEPTWEWAEDGSAATATFTANQDASIQQTLDAEISSVVRTEPGCETPGLRENTAKVTFREREYTDVRTYEIPATGHGWSEPAFTWNGYKSATATRICAKDLTHVETKEAVVTAEVTTAPTMTEDGVRTYTAAVEFDGVTYTDTKTETIPATGLVNPFVDVKEGDFFYDAVLWAFYHDPQITAGTSKTKFSPAKTCTREQVVTFLWRAKGCEEPKNTQNPFKDVPADAYYTKAVLWAVENGITNGKSKIKFGVGDACTREQVVTFLWRAEGKPEPTSAANPFKDVSETSYSYDAILWAVEKGITKGTSKTKFSPAKTCTRGQVVTFLYRDVVGEQ